MVDGTFTKSPQVLVRSSSANLVYNNNMTANTTNIRTFNNVSGTTAIVRIYFENGTTFNCTLYTMLLEGTYTSSNIPAYTPHQEQTQIVSLGDIELCKIGNYQDYLYKSGDKWYKKEQIGKVVFTGTSSENWQTRSGGTSYAYMRNNTFDGNGTLGLSNYFKFIQNGASGSQANECIASASANTSLSIFTNNSSLNTLSNFTTWLSTHNLIVYYQLATANDIEITNETLIEQLNNLEKAQSYNGITNISSNGNLPIVLGVSALKGE